MGTEIFSDVDLLFGQDIYGDVARKYDINSIKQAVIDVVLTQKGEKLDNIDYGTRVHALLFESVDSDYVEDLIVDEIEEALKEFEPRINVVSVTAEPHGLEANSLKIVINFSILNFTEIYSVDIILERVR